MQKLTEKKFIKRQTFAILKQILMDLLEPEEAAKVSDADVQKQFQKASYYKSHETGEIRVGLSFKGVRKLVKKNPYIAVTDIKAYFNIG